MYFNVNLSFDYLKYTTLYIICIIYILPIFLFGEKYLDSLGQTFPDVELWTVAQPFSATIGSFNIPELLIILLKPEAGDMSS